MLLDQESAVEADLIEAESSVLDTKSQRKSSTRLSDSDQLYVWHILIGNNLVGALSPTNSKSWLKPHYECLLPDSLIVREVNRVSDVEITVDTLKAIVRRFQGTRGPYDPANLPSSKTPRKRCK